MLADSVKGSSVRMTMYVRVTEFQYYCIHTVRTQYITQNSDSESKNPELRIKCEK
jgi:hypothetical protein